MRGVLAILGAWTVYALVHASFWIATGDMPGTYWRWKFMASLVLAWSWGLLTPAIFRLTKSVAPSRVGWPASIASHALMLIALALGMAWLRDALIRAFTGIDIGPFFPRAVFWFDVNVFTYLTVVLTGWALQSHRRYLDRALRAHVLETQLARAQLHFLELQLQPHFLFNSLNAIQELAHEAPDAAERMLRRLYALLAMSLERSGRDEVSLHDELTALEPYVDIQRTRFEWLNVSIDADPAAQEGLVPHLILQPLVENAIRHGLAVRRARGHVTIRAVRVGDRLLLQVRDDGVGLQPLALGTRPGIGLRNARERLRQLYGADHRFVLHEAADGGTVVEIDVPYRPDTRRAHAPSWTEMVRSRETMPEVPVEDVAAWATGEFIASIKPPRIAAADDDGARDPDGSETATHGPSSDAPSAAGTEEPALAGQNTPIESAPPLLSVWVVGTLLAIWLGAATLWIVQLRLQVHLSHETYDRQVDYIQIAGATYWLAVSFGVLYLARRFRLRRRRLLPHLAIHLGAAVASSFGFLYVLQLLQFTSDPLLNPYNVNPLSGNFFLYFGLLAWSHSRDFVAWYRAREITAAQLTSDIARSRFHALCVQVRPQFLLGTLDLLARLVHLDVPRADRLIARLADVLRLTLDMAGEHVTLLQEELHLVSATVEAHRLGIRPAVSLDVDVDAHALGTRMPSRLLCTMVDDLLVAEPGGAATPLVVRIRAERGPDATRVRLHGDAAWKPGSGDLHAWWRTKSVAEATVADAGPLVSVAFPDRTTAVLIIADDQPPDAAAFAAA